MATADLLRQNRQQDAQVRTYAHMTPWLAIQDLEIVSVEHPCAITNIDRAVKSLGGDSAITKLVVSKEDDSALGLYVRPDDPLCRRILSTESKTSNILLKVVVPKTTGRKRKRGSQGPFEEEPRDVEVHVDADEPLQHRSKRGPSSSCSAGAIDSAKLMRMLRDNEEKFSIVPVGVIDRTRRFRSMPDFQYSATGSPFMSQMRDKILSFDYLQMKKFVLDPSKGTKIGAEIIPPPNLSHISVPFNYSYRQNPAVKLVVDEYGGRRTINTQSATKVLTSLVVYDVATVPSSLPEGLPPIESLEPGIQQAIHELRALLEDRPIWSRRALLNNIGSEPQGYALKTALQYVGYMFRSGPWRDSIVRFGTDPRSDPKYRVYQTLMFQLPTRDGDVGERRWQDERTKYHRLTKGKEQDKSSHLFDGRNLTPDGKVWQVCDITDPLLRKLLDTEDIRIECEKGDGWYHNGTWAKVKVIMKAKIKSIIEGAPMSDTDFSKIMELPNIIDNSTREQAVMEKGKVSAKETQWASEFRMIANPSAPREAAATVAQDNIASSGGDYKAGKQKPGSTAAQDRSIDARVAEMMLELGRSGPSVTNHSPIAEDDDNEGDGFYEFEEDGDDGESEEPVESDGEEDEGEGENERTNVHRPKQDEK
ncbi:MAG: hypothetical protein M1819_002911 [Sarea resinae]|nr:MAG: hypothetical protein M1819_002911 [Sarea resinae]